MVPKKAKQSNMFLKWHQNMTLDHEFPSSHKVMYAKFDVEFWNLHFFIYFLALPLKEINIRIESSNVSKLIFVLKILKNRFLQ